MADPIDLDAVASELRGLEAKATPGPWEIAGCDGERTGINGPSGYSHELGPIHGQLEVYGGDDASLIVALRNAIGPLLEERERLWAMLRLVVSDTVFVNFGNYAFSKPPDEFNAASPLGFNVLCSDTFGWACADAERISLEDAPALLKLAQEGGWPALARWVQDKRGGPEAAPFIEPVRKYVAEDDQLRARISALEQRLAEARAAIPEAEAAVRAAGGKLAAGVRTATIEECARECEDASIISAGGYQGDDGRETLRQAAAAIRSLAAAGSGGRE